MGGWIRDGCVQQEQSEWMWPRQNDGQVDDLSFSPTGARTKGDVNREARG